MILIFAYFTEGHIFRKKKNVGKKKISATIVRNEWFLVKGFKKEQVGKKKNRGKKCLGKQKKGVF